MTTEQCLMTWLLVGCLSFPLVTQAQVRVPEIADPSLPDIAMVRPDPTHGAVIIYNPVYCQQIGQACGFFRAHEYGHVALGHHLRHPAHYPAQREAEADCWAAHHAHPYEILAAYQLFMSGHSSHNWQIYGQPQQRAERVRQCALQAGRWIGH